MTLQTYIIQMPIEQPTKECLQRRRQKRNKFFRKTVDANPSILVKIQTTWRSFVAFKQYNHLKKLRRDCAIQQYHLYIFIVMIRSVLSNFTDCHTTTTELVSTLTDMIAAYVVLPDVFKLDRKPMRVMTNKIAEIMRSCSTEEEAATVISVIRKTLATASTSNKINRIDRYTDILSCLDNGVQKYTNYIMIAQILQSKKKIKKERAARQKQCKWSTEKCGLCDCVGDAKKTKKQCMFFIGRNHNKSCAGHCLCLSCYVKQLQLSTPNPNDDSPYIHPRGPVHRTYDGALIRGEDGYPAPPTLHLILRWLQTNPDIKCPFCNESNPITGDLRVKLGIGLRHSRTLNRHVSLPPWNESNDHRWEQLYSDIKSLF